MEEYYYPKQLDNKRGIQLDIFFPSHGLAFEYQGEQHYYDIYALGPKWYQKLRDQEKKTFCQEHDITLIEVPYWSDCKKLSLMATVSEIRPDLIPVKGNFDDPIPLEPFHRFPNGPLNQLMHGEEWDGKQDLTGWSVLLISYY